MKFCEPLFLRARKPDVLKLLQNLKGQSHVVCVSLQAHASYDVTNFDVLGKKYFRNF